jgi:TonB family protein
MTETIAPAYPPIARAAHVTGMVILIATFDDSGAVTATRVVSGPPMLQEAAKQYVAGWHANAKPGIRNCPVVMSFAFRNSEPCTGGDLSVSASRSDTQHVTISTDTIWLCDPAATIGHRHHWFWPF